MRGLLYALLAALFVVRIDLWLWDDPRIVFGLPVGLTYHVLYCLAVALVMALLVRYAWPVSEEAED
jgi:hypothetical protein